MKVFGHSLNTSLSYLVIMDNMYHLVSISYPQARCLKTLLYIGCSLIESSQKTTKVLLFLSHLQIGKLGLQQVICLKSDC